MHVAIKQTVLDRIQERIHVIKQDNREPEYIAVTPTEYDELRDDRRVYGYLQFPHTTWDPRRDAPVASKPFDTREFTLRREFLRDQLGYAYRTYSRETFMGYPLYVVPPEYMPS